MTCMTRIWHAYDNKRCWKMSHTSQLEPLPIRLIDLFLHQQCLNAPPKYPVERLLLSLEVFPNWLQKWSRCLRPCKKLQLPSAPPSMHTHDAMIWRWIFYSQYPVICANGYFSAWLEQWRRVWTWTRSWRWDGRCLITDGTTSASNYGSSVPPRS